MLEQINTLLYIFFRIFDLIYIYQTLKKKKSVRIPKPPIRKFTAPRMQSQNKPIPRVHNIYAIANQFLYLFNFDFIYYF